MKKPKITLSELLVRFPNLPKDGAYLVGIRGYFLNSIGVRGANDLGFYDDAIILVNGSEICTFNGNTDPSKEGKGLAMLKVGSYQYYKGKHRGKYNALRPFPEGVKMPCTRDGKDSFAIACNIHKGGNTTTGSEGCQTIPPVQWDEFIGLVYSVMDKNKMQTINYFLYE